MHLYFKQNKSYCCGKSLISICAELLLNALLSELKTELPNKQGQHSVYLAKVLRLSCAYLGSIASMVGIVPHMSDSHARA